MSLGKLLGSIKEQKALAEENVESGPIETLNARRGRQRQAVDQLKLLREQYIQELMRSALFIVAVGSDSEDFAKVLSSEYGAFSSDSESFYNDLSGRVHQSLYLGRESSSGLFDTLGRHLEDKAIEMKILGYPQLIFKSQYKTLLDSPAAFTKIVKQAINEQVGSEIVGINAVRSVVDEAIKKEHSDRVTPIVLSVKDPSLALDLMDTLPRLTPNTVMVTVGRAPKEFKSRSVATVKKLDAENIEQTLNTIKSKIILR